MEFKDFGKKLATIRSGKNISAYELSLSIGKDASYIHKVENSKINISLKTILQISDVLKINPKILFD